jgi:hypothetical protein
MVAVTRLTGALITVLEEQCHDDASWIASIWGHAGGAGSDPRSRLGVESEGLVSVQIVMELLRPRGVAELGERLRRDLPDSLPSEVELATDLIEGSGMAVQ